MARGQCVISWGSDEKGRIPITCSQVIMELTDLFHRVLTNQELSDDDKETLEWIKSEGALNV